MECEYVGMEWTYIMNVDMNILHLYFDKNYLFIINILIVIISSAWFTEDDRKSRVSILQAGTCEN